MSTTAPVKPTAQTLQVLGAMEENTGHMTTLLEDIIKRLDAQAATSDQRHGDQFSFNAQISTDLAAVRKQLALTQADVDETRKALSASPGSVASTSLDPRLVNPAAPPDRKSVV